MKNDTIQTFHQGPLVHWWSIHTLRHQLRRGGGLSTTWGPTKANTMYPADKIAISWHLAIPGCGRWFTVWLSRADLLTFSHPQISASRLLGLQVQTSIPSWPTLLWFVFAIINSPVQISQKIILALQMPWANTMALKKQTWTYQQQSWCHVMILWLTWNLLTN